MYIVILLLDYFNQRLHIGRLLEGLHSFCDFFCYVHVIIYFDSLCLILFFKVYGQQTKMILPIKLKTRIRITEYIRKFPWYNLLMSVSQCVHPALLYWYVWIVCNQYTTELKFHILYSVVFKYIYLVLWVLWSFHILTVDGGSIGNVMCFVHCLLPCWKGNSC